MADSNTLDTISLALTIDNKEFNSGLQKSINKLNAFKTSIESATESFSRFSNAITNSGAASLKLVDIANTMQDASSKIKDAFENVTAEGGGSGTSGVKSTKSALDEVTKSIGGVVKGFGELALKINPVKIFGSMAKSVGNLFSQMKRVAMYRLLRTAIKTLTQGIQEGTENLYRYSKAFGTAFSQNMDRLATAGLYLKNSLGAMISPIINAITPIVDTIIDKIVDAINWINRTIAELTGASTWTQALRYETQYKDGLDDANGSAKKLKATILGIDEINPLNDNSSGSGSSSNAKDYSKMFKEVATTGKKTLNEMLKNFDAKGLGKKLGESISKAMRTIHEWYDKIDFEELGRKIVEFIEGVNWKELLANVGQLIYDGIKAAFKLVKGAFDANPILTGIILGIGALSFSGVGSLLLTKCFGTFTPASIKAVIVAAIGGFSLGNWLYENDVLGLGRVADYLVETIGDNGLWNGIGQIMKDSAQGWGLIWDWFKEKLEGLWDNISWRWGEKWDIVGKKLNEWGENIKETWENIKSKILEVLGIEIEYNNRTQGKNPTALLDKLYSGATGTYTELTKSFEKFKESMNGADVSLTSYINKQNSFASAFKSSANTVVSGINSATSSYNTALGKLQKQTAQNPFSTIGYNLSGVTARADGGYVTSGDMFIANENGANEFVGHIGSTTAVANNDQIVSAVASGVASASAVEVALLREQNALLSKILAKDGSVSISTGAISNGLSLQNKINGVSTVAFS